MAFSNPFVVAAAVFFIVVPLLLNIVLLLARKYAHAFHFAIYTI